MSGLKIEGSSKVPTFKIIKFTNKIAIANKESIICAWNLLKKELELLGLNVIIKDWKSSNIDWQKQKAAVAKHIFNCNSPQIETVSQNQITKRNKTFV